MTNVYHATPYDLHTIGFYFSTYDEYLEKSATHTNEFGQHIEEYEIQFIDGDNAALFKAIGVNQANLEQWFDDFEGMNPEDAVKAIYLIDYNGCVSDDILSQLEDVCLFEGSALEYTEQYIEDTGMLDEMPENLRYYFDTGAFARDLVISGDISEVEIGGTNYIVWGC
ncbi:antirestriction protein ArdA [Kordiimonas pumila]|uniref:Antirestriction protein ArdA n=1 Tax=Kordiimonas pumila TaxID=2161677 RepID=A0ABV7D531_9PROT|nr:antirestriction protein ArdA [Kordiimonas pumila]